MWIKWFPWRFFIKRLARSHGFVDPVTLLAQFNKFSLPADVVAPTELLRAGVVLQARGLINSQAIQHNLDWVWPYWVTRQFDPTDDSFIPRAFSISHINLTHRNWTAVGIPGFSQTPIVDPRGLIMPYFDSWSLDFWICSGNGALVVPSQMANVEQEMFFENGLGIRTRADHESATLESRVDVVLQSGRPVMRASISARAPAGSFIVVSVRPYNPEGVSFISSVSKKNDGRELIINKKDSVYFDGKPEKIYFSRYHDGDVFRKILSREHETLDAIKCETGMATTAALFEIQAGKENTIRVFFPLETAKPPFDPAVPYEASAKIWGKSLEGTCSMKIPDRRMQFLFENAVRTIILHSPKPDEVYAGPFIYKRFWFRDAVLIVHAMLMVGLFERAKGVIDSFFKRQNVNGYFMSQDGEWDSNGQVLWILKKFCDVTGQGPDKGWKKGVVGAARWIQRKLQTHGRRGMFDGLLPAGFSAEHLGPNDQYYWDDFWAVAGLNAATDILTIVDQSGEPSRFRESAGRLMDAIECSLQGVEKRIGRPIIPASPYRRMDSGAVGSLVADYPLQLYAPADPRIKATVDYLVSTSFVDGAFFHDISHSGINPYLTLYIAQSLLRSGDERFLPPVESLARLASPTGQWPEAIHPRTRAGCMGDGQHVWAASEWIVMLRNMFVREAEKDRALILCSGIPKKWLTHGGESLFFGPAPTIFGNVRLSISVNKETVRLSWEAHWHGRPPRIDVRFFGAPAIIDCREGFAAVPLSGGWT